MSSYSGDTSPSLRDLFALDGRVALVAGGAGLLGTQISAALAELGARVVIASRDFEHCGARAAEIESVIPGSVASALSLDITDPQSVVDCIHHIENDLGTLDILVNCGWSGRKNTLESITDADWDADIEVSLTGVFRLTRAALGLLKVRPGVVLNIASMYGYVAPDYRLYEGDERLANPPSYGAAKAGVIQLTRYMGSFLAPYGVRVNCISPGPFPYEATQREFPDFIDRLASRNPLGRIGRPYEIKGAAALLCSDASSYITGQNIPVDGGWTIW